MQNEILKKYITYENLGDITYLSKKEKERTVYNKVKNERWEEDSEG